MPNKDFDDAPKFDVRRVSLMPRRRRDTWLQVVTIVTLLLQAVIMVYPEVCGPLRVHQTNAISK